MARDASLASGLYRRSRGSRDAELRASRYLKMPEYGELRQPIFESWKVRDAVKGFRLADVQWQEKASSRIFLYFFFFFLLSNFCRHSTVRIAECKSIFEYSIFRNASTLKILYSAAALARLERCSPIRGAFHVTRVVCIEWI